MRLFICGPARHGKDTVAYILREEFGLTHESSSHLAMRIFLRQLLGQKYGLWYASDDHCYEDRVNHREIWYNEIKAYNAVDLSRLSREIFNFCDIYVGIRDREEFLASKYLATLSIWVDARPRLEITGQEQAFQSKLVREQDCDFTICNAGTLDDLRRKVRGLFNLIYPTHAST